MLSQNQMVKIRKAKESMYIGVLSVVEYRKVKNEDKEGEVENEVEKNHDFHQIYNLAQDFYDGFGLDID